MQSFNQSHYQCICILYLYSCIILSCVIIKYSWVFCFVLFAQTGFHAVVWDSLELHMSSRMTLQSCFSCLLLSSTGTIASHLAWFIIQFHVTYSAGQTIPIVRWHSEQSAWYEGVRWIGSPGSRVKSRYMEVYICKPTTGRWKHPGLQSSLASQGSRNGTLRVQWETCLTK